MPPVRNPAPQPIASLTSVMMLLLKGGRRRSPLITPLIPQVLGIFTNRFIMRESSSVSGWHLTDLERVIADIREFLDPSPEPSVALRRSS